MQARNNLSYEEKWRDYRNRRLIFWIVFLSYVPGVSFIGFQLQKLFNSEMPVYFAAGVWMIAFAVVGLRLTYWRCPHCGKFFFAKWWGVNHFARKCLHCGLPKWTSEDP